MKDDDDALDELFAAARNQQPPAGAEARGWARFESALGGPGGPPPGAAAPTALGWLAPAAKLGGVAAAVLAVGVALGWPDDPPRARRSDAAAPSTTSPTSEPPLGPVAPAIAPDSPAAPDPGPPSALPRANAQPQSATGARSSTPRPTAKPELSSTPEPASASTPATASAPAPAPEVVVVQRPTAPSPAPTDSLRLEAELLGRAWVAIRERRAEDTRALLAEHARRFPEGALVPERRACQVVASCIAGDRDAIDRAQRYLDEHRASHLADRVAAGCGLRTPTRASDSEAAATDDPERVPTP